MAAAPIRSASARRAATVLGVTTALAACATDPPGAVSASDGLFKAQVGDISGGVAPGPHSVWYVQDRPVSYVKIGVATWRPARLPAWLARLVPLRHAKAAQEPIAVAAANLGLPVPSRVQVTNLVTGATVTVRVNDKAPMTASVIRLPPEAAQALGVPVGQPLAVRLRYVEPLIAYNTRPTLRYVLRGPLPPAEARPIAVAQAAVAAPAESIAATPPMAAAPAADPAPPATPTVAEVARELRPAQAAVAPPQARLAHVQAGAFASLANAERAVDLLRPVGAATIRPARRGAVTLYRVIVPAPRGTMAAERMRARVVQIGFPDARLVTPL